MAVTEQIEFDIQCLRVYFKKLFDLEAEHLCADSNNFAPFKHSIAPFIKPDMACNVYSLVDFWMKKLCLYQEQKNKLALGFKDIKGKNDFDAYHKYLIKVAMIDLSAVEDNYKRLQRLRKVRNKLIHDGGHILSDKDEDISKTRGVRLSGSLIVIDNSFIWESLDDAAVYLCSIAQTSQVGRVRRKP